MKKKQGFTLMEVLMVVGPLALLIYLASTMIVDAIKTSLKTESKQSDAIDFSTYVRNFLLTVKSAVPLSPSEDAYSVGDLLYRGISTIDRSQTSVFDAYCAVSPSDGTYSLLRITYIDPKLKALSALRPYQFAQTDGTPVGIALRTSLANSDVNYKGPLPGEVVAVDVDGKYMNRFAVLGAGAIPPGAVNQIGLFINPYDDTPSNDNNPPGENPGPYSWTDFRLAQAKSVNGALLPPSPSQYISNSGIFRTHTSVICVNAATNKQNEIVEIDSATVPPTVSTIFSFAVGHNIKNFKVSFANQNQKITLGSSLFMDYTSFANGGDYLHDINCINALKVEFAIQSKDPKAGPTAAYQETEFALLRNFAQNRAANCDPP